MTRSILLTAALLHGCTGPRADDSAADTSEPPIGEACAEPAAVMSDHCTSCHNSTNAVAGLSLANIGTAVGADSTQSELPLIAAGDPDQSYLLHKMRGTHGVVGGMGTEMPPPGLESVPEARIQLIADWIAAGASCEGGSPDTGSTLDPLPPWEPAGEPGYVVLRRLTADMVDRTLSDLFLIDSHQARDRFPSDGEAFGFDNNAAAVTMTLLHIETAEAAIDAVLDQALEPPVTVQSYLWQAEDPLFSGTGTVTDLGAWPNRYPGVRWYFTATRGGLISVPYAGEYTFTVRACGRDDEGGDLPEFQLRIDGQLEGTVVVDNLDCENPVEYVFTDPVELPEGEFTIEIGLTNDPTNDLMSLAVDWFAFEGPLDATGTPSDSRAHIYVCDPALDGSDPDDCARDIVSAFLPRAWRRPVTGAEVDDILAAYTRSRDSGGDFDEGIRLALKVALLSPHFLFLVELDPDLNDAAPHDLSAHELAARISYFVWNSMPDAELSAVADDGTLLTPDVQEAQVRRMLQDERARALVQNMAGQWWGMRALMGENTAPSGEHFPTFDESLRDAMHHEMQLFAEGILLGDRPLSDVLTATDHYVDDDLAAHYGVAAPVTPFDPVSVPTHDAIGLMGLSGWLTATSTPTRTSPVKRGAWVLSNLLCEQPPPPPDDVITVIGEEDDPTSMREQLEQHRADPACASCHNAIDPIGLAFEGYDGIGQERTQDAWGNPVDPSGELPGIGAFTDATDMVALLQDDPRVGRCMVHKTFIYALGRGTGPMDVPTVMDIESRYLSEGGTFADLAVAIVQSDAFRQEGPQ